MQRVRVIGQGFKPFKLPKLWVGRSVNYIGCGLLPASVLIDKRVGVGGSSLFLDTLIMLCIIKFIEITFDFSVLNPDKFHGISTVSYTHLDVYKRQGRGR